MNKSIYTKAYQKFLSFLKESRISAGITQVELAKKLGTSQSVISKCEIGERRVDLIEFINICKVLKLDPIKAIKNINKFKSKK
jgi:transcriptional regulator with XRE-family HTH domain